MRGAVCAVTLDLVLVGDFLVQRIGARCLRQLLEEGGVEDINLRNLREQLAHDSRPLGLRAVVQRSEHSQLLDLGSGVGGHQGRVREGVAALDNSVPDGDDAGLFKARAVFLEEPEHALEALLMVFDLLVELVLFAVVFVLVVAVNRFADLLDDTRCDSFAGLEIYQLVLDRARTRIDNKDGFRHCGILHW